MTRSAHDDARSGLVAGGRGGPEDQLLDDGQEEVFAREEVELGRIEHHVEAGGARDLETGAVSARPSS